MDASASIYSQALRAVTDRRGERPAIPNPPSDPLKLGAYLCACDAAADWQRDVRDECRRIEAALSLAPVIILAPTRIAA